MKLSYSKLLALIAILLTFAVGLFAQGPSGESDPLLQCNADIAISEVGASVKEEVPFKEHREKVKNELLTQIRDHIDLMVKKHKELVKYRPQIKTFYTQSLNRSINTPDRGQLVIALENLVMRFNNSGELDCMILDNFYTPVDYPENFSRRLVRVYYPDIHTMDFVTSVKSRRYRSELGSLPLDLQVESLQMLEKKIRGASLAVDLQLSLEMEKSRNIVEWQLGY